MCLEGGCGACAVTVHQDQSTWTVNSCLFPIFSCHKLRITTIEGIGNRRTGYHELQKTLAKFNGTQCGYCSPGMIMNMHGLMEQGKGVVSKQQVEDAFSGHICRCTGYRPILDAFKSLAVDSIPDIEDLSRCQRKCESRNLCLTDPEGRRWYKVGKVSEILQIFNEINKLPYMLVHGNTAKGVYPDTDHPKIFIDITDVAELHQITFQDVLVFGGNVTLANALKAFQSSTSSKFQYLQDLFEHLSLVANVPVRNIGSLAGNLSIKHQHNEFPSDVFLMLETVGAVFEITGIRGTQSMKPSDYLKVDMTKKVITKITLPPLPVDQYIMKSYKVSPNGNRQPLMTLL